jgi:hypothetical protein
VRAAALALLLCACGPELGAPLPITELDADDYRLHVDPVARFSCASLECHGVEGRPLRIYAEDGLRLDASLRGEALSTEEAAWNAQAFAGVDPEPESVDEHLALLKPLSLEAGGIHHVGEQLWPDREDPSYVCLRAWLANEGMDAGAIAACDAAEAALSWEEP